MSSSTFSELLQRKKESYDAEAVKNKELIGEWSDSVSKLFAQLRDWLNVSDPTKVLDIEESMTEVHEPNVGRYKIPRLNIRAFGKWVGIIPKARKTVGAARPPRAAVPPSATGRVDITDELRRYVLYRFGQNGSESWFIEGPTSDAPEELTKERFEEALMSYFV